MHRQDKSRMSTQWDLPDGFPDLEDNEVQVWRIQSSGTTGLTDQLPPLLSGEEQIHLKRLKNSQVRDHFIIGRTCLRILLGNIQKVDPRNVTITTATHGKPETPLLGEHTIFFNLAHSRDTILIALGRQGPVGVDLEHVDRSTDIMEVAEANFTKQESGSLAAIADTELRRRTFFHYWTRKEAVGKADGRGLLLPLASFDVSFESMTSHPVRVNEFTAGDEEEGKLYFVSDLDLGGEAVAALALQSSGCRINTMVFPPALYPVAKAAP
jgi:4'-phosphopantetheinyl transferase